jgi:hypothetical protein
MIKVLVEVSVDTDNVAEAFAQVNVHMNRASSFPIKASEKVYGSKILFQSPEIERVDLG